MGKGTAGREAKHHAEKSYVHYHQAMDRTATHFSALACHSPQHRTATINVQLPRNPIFSIDVNSLRHRRYRGGAHLVLVPIIIVSRASLK